MYTAEDFEKLALKLLECTSKDFSETYRILLKRYPRCANWIDWYMRPSRRKVAFPVSNRAQLCCVQSRLTGSAQSAFKDTQTPKGWRRVPSNTNASESCGADIKKSGKYTQ